jgi:hypothetical protein
MIISALDCIRDLLADKADARKTAELFCRSVKPQWDGERECLVAIHPDDQRQYEVAVQDCNGSLGVSFCRDEDGALRGELSDDSGDWSETCLIAILRDCDQQQSVFFVDDSFEFSWR